MSGKGKKTQQQQSKTDTKSSSSSASSIVSTGPVNWRDNPQYYEYLLSLRQKNNPDSWKTDLDKMITKFPGVNFTIDGVQTYHKKQQDNIKIAENALSESDDVSCTFEEVPMPKVSKSKNKEAADELVRVTLQSEIKELTQQINNLELEREKKSNALELHNKIASIVNK